MANLTTGALGRIQSGENVSDAIVQVPTGFSDSFTTIKINKTSTI